MNGSRFRVTGNASNYIMLLLLVFTAGMFGLRNLQNHCIQIRACLILKEQQLEKEWLALNRHPTPPLLARSLRVTLENAAMQLNLKEKLQLNLIPDPPAGMAGIRVRLDQLNLDDMFDILYFLENHKPVLLIEQWEIIAIPRSDLLRLSFRIYKREPA